MKTVRTGSHARDELRRGEDVKTKVSDEFGEGICSSAENEGLVLYLGFRDMSIRGNCEARKL